MQNTGLKKICNLVEGESSSCLNLNLITCRESYTLPLPTSSNGNSKYYKQSKYENKSLNLIFKSLI